VTWSGVIGLYESSNSCTLPVHDAWVTQGDSDNNRGTLFSNYTDANEASSSTSTAGEGCSGTLASTFSAKAGDRIVLEIGAKHNTTNTSYYSRLYYGGSGADLADNGDATANVGWIKFPYSAPSAAGAVIPAILKTLCCPATC
jgi:hypothetical protein